jgi:hypothetical protein
LGVCRRKRGAEGRSRPASCAHNALNLLPPQNKTNSVYGLVGVAANNAIREHPTVDPVVASGKFFDCLRERRCCVCGSRASRPASAPANTPRPRPRSPPNPLKKTKKKKQSKAYSSHAVLSTLFPWVQAYNGLLDKQVAGKTLPDEDTLEAIRRASTDLVAQATASTGPSSFKFAPNGTLWAYQLAPKQKYALYPQLGNSAPLVSSSVRLTEIAANTDAAKGPVFRPPSPDRTVDYETTYKLGNLTSPQRSQYDTDSAFFWADGANTSTIAGHWLNVSLAVLPDDFSVPDTALFLARAFGAAWDASVAGWKVKYDVLQWRPVSAFAIGYPAVGKVAARAADPYWAQLLPATPAHPEYPSGHQITVGAILEVLLQTLGKDDVEFSIGTEGAPSIGLRKYKSITAAANEVGDSRVYGGVHFNASSVDGLTLGRLVGAQAFKDVGAPRLSAEVVPAAAADGAAKDKAAAVPADKKADVAVPAAAAATAAAAVPAAAAAAAAAAPKPAAIATKPAAVVPAAAKSSSSDKADKAADKAEKAVDKADKAAENAANKAAQAEDLGTKKAQKDADKAADKADKLEKKAEKAVDKADKKAAAADEGKKGGADDKASEKKGGDEKSGAKTAAVGEGDKKAAKADKAERPRTKTTLFAINFNKGGRKLMRA